MPRLRAVGDGERPEAPKPPLSLIDAVEAGDYMGILKAQRREIAAALPDEKGPAKAALHRQLTLIAKEIDVLELKEQVEAAEDGEHISAELEWDADAI
jgi:hypothetical protein